MTKTLAQKLLDEMSVKENHYEEGYQLEFDSKNKLTKLYYNDKYIAKFHEEKEALKLIGLLNDLLF